MILYFTSETDSDLIFACPRSKKEMPRSILNWAETVEAETKQFRFPKDVDEVVELVKSHKKIRCAGALHSCAPLIASEGIIMSLTKLDQIIDINPETRIVKCQSGVPIYELCNALAPHGLAVGTLGTIDWQVRNPNLCIVLSSLIIQSTRSLTNKQPSLLATMFRRSRGL